MPNPWDKLPAETDEAYARFLMYRNLGPKRSMRRAYFLYLQEYDGYRGGKERIHVPGSWTEEASRHFWSARSAQWDVRNLSTYGAKIVALHAEAIRNLAEKNLRLSKRMNPGDDGWDDLITSLRTVQTFLTPEIVSGVQGHRKQPAGEPAAAAAGDVE